MKRDWTEYYLAVAVAFGVVVSAIALAISLGG